MIGVQTLLSKKAFERQGGRRFARKPGLSGRSAAGQLV
jgi:hypothetical protein